MSPKTATVVSRDQAVILPAGSHKAITDDLLLPAGIPTPVPAAALPFVLTYPGVEQSPTADPSEPAITEE